MKYRVIVSDKASDMLKKHIYFERIYVFLYQNIIKEYYNNIPITE